MRFHSLICAIEKGLRQQLGLLSVLSAEQYSAPAQSYFKSSAGMHIRHNLDHFSAFFDGLAMGKIDYEGRERDEEVEQVPTVAMDLIEKCINLLDLLRKKETDTSLNIREESESNTDAKVLLLSSVGRELQFLLGHTVHHNALIAMIVHSQGISLPAGFGVAPSTQRHAAKTEKFKT
jgi:hypothetical protein